MPDRQKPIDILQNKHGRFMVSSLDGLEMFWEHMRLFLGQMHRLVVQLAERLAWKPAHVEVHKSRRMQGFAWHVMEKTVLLGKVLANTTSFAAEAISRRKAE